MLKAIVFIILFLVNFISFMLIPKMKGDEKLNVVKSAVMCYFTVLSIDVNVAFVLYKLNIPVNINVISIIHLITAVIAIAYIYRKKKIQKYKLELGDILSVGVVLFITLVVFWRVFTFNIDFNYINSDPGGHFSEALKFIKDQRLGKMPFSKLYNAMIINVFILINPSFSTYSAFVIADTLSNIMSGIMFYALFSEVIKHKLVRKLIPIFVAFYYVGWPVYNYVMGGFVYWGIGTCLVMYGLYLIIKLQKEEIDIKYFVALILLNIVSIANCYMMFAPYMMVIYAVILLQIFWAKIPNKKKLIRIAIISFLVATVLVGILLVWYFHGDVDRFFYWLGYDGGIHRSLYKDMIYFLPFSVIVLFKMRKEKKINVINVAYWIYSILVAMSLILELTGIMSSYYYYKLYYILWVLSWINAGVGLEIVLEEKQKWAIGYIGMLAMMFIYSFSPLEEWEYNSYGFNAFKQSPEFPMYSEVGSFLKNKPDLWAYPEDKDFFDLADYVYKMKVDVPVLSGEKNQGDWYKKLAVNERFDEFKMTNVEKEFFQDVVENKDYFCVEKCTNYYKEQKDYLKSKYDIIYEADYGVVYKKN